MRQSLFHLGWFTKSWWKYLFHKKNRHTNWVTVVLCRARGHTDVWWFNPGGLEPDMNCTRCGDDLG